jgi:hypothetical protein
VDKPVYATPTTKQPAKTTPKTKHNKIHKQKDMVPKKPTTTQDEKNKRTEDWIYSPRVLYIFLKKYLKHHTPIKN